jgi:hypothetical protein
MTAKEIEAEERNLYWVPWVPWSEPGCEHLHLRIGGDGVRVAADADGEAYRYDGFFRNFSCKLRVDADGLVLDYPETFRRLWPQPQEPNLGPLPWRLRS